MPYTLDLTTGTGLQLIDVDISGSDADLLAAGSTVSGRLVWDEDESVVGNEEVDIPAAIPNAPSGKDAQVYNRTVDAIVPYDALTFRFPARLSRRGVYRLSISITDADGDTSSAKDSIMIGAGDGLPVGLV